MVGAVARQRRAPGSVVDAALIRIPAFVAGVIAALLSYVGPLRLPRRGPVLPREVAPRRPAAVGLELSALPVALAVVAPLGGAIRDRIGPRVPTGAGMLLTADRDGAAGGLGDPNGSDRGRAGDRGRGHGAVRRREQRGDHVRGAASSAPGAAGGLLNMARGLGTALGVALPSLVFASGRGITSVAVLLLGVALLAGGHQRDLVGVRRSGRPQSV